MTEAEWLACEDPHRLIDLLGADGSRRKLRHFVCACVRYMWRPPMDEETARTLALAERIADDVQNVDRNEWIAANNNYLQRWTGDSYAPDDNAGLLLLAVGLDVLNDAIWLVRKMSDSEKEWAGALLREVFGNPFCPVAFSPSWRTDTTVALARQMYESRDFSAMPILADALQDTGCDSADILDHCRGPGPHVRGCWCVDLVLGKE
jgi:hypothetical protein